MLHQIIIYFFVGVLHQIFSCIKNAKCAVSEEVLKMQFLKTKKEALAGTETALVDMEEREEDAPIGKYS